MPCPAPILRFFRFERYDLRLPTCFLFCGFCCRPAFRFAVSAAGLLFRFAVSAAGLLFALRFLLPVCFLLCGFNCRHAFRFAIVYEIFLNMVQDDCFVVKYSICVQVKHHRVQ